MKICFIAPKAYQLFNPEVKSTFGGAEVQLSILAKELAKNKTHDINFIVANYEQPDKEKIDNVTIWKALNFQKPFIFQAINILFILNKIKADVYIQRTLTKYSWLIGLLAKIKNKKFVYMVAHDSETDGSHRIQRTAWGRLLTYLNFKLASKIIIQNEYQKNSLWTKSYILNSSFDIIKKKNTIKSTILWVGRSEEWKRPELFLQLSKVFPLEKFIIICPPATENKKLANKIEEIAKSIPNLTFEKFVPFNKINDYFEEAKVFINTSTKEGFPNTFLQAMVAQTPIISLKVNPNNFLEIANCGFHCNDHFPTMIEKLTILLSDKHLYHQKSVSGFEYIKKNHDVKNNTEKLLNIINNEL